MQRNSLTYFQARSATTYPVAPAIHVCLNGVTVHTMYYYYSRDTCMLHALLLDPIAIYS
ncbi:hypothetical protein BDV36DRAFT_271933 [Aspergillus pseudocaelatus]|uniref:Uncharacterized protein n=1 Tax=Aspergillus pseudocaelatus TaxID=1825620 RepID=A0ABQ6W523_9EURO|nr:hypothetical protein BDV36DRAFT_271933 [Aspergillus pseudocaelatus]